MNHIIKNLLGLHKNCKHNSNSMYQYHNNLKMKLLFGNFLPYQQDNSLFIGHFLQQNMCNLLFLSIFLNHFKLNCIIFRLIQEFLVMGAFLRHRRNVVVFIVDVLAKFFCSLLMEIEDIWVLSSLIKFEFNLIYF